MINIGGQGLMKRLALICFVLVVSGFMTAPAMAADANYCAKIENDIRNYKGAIEHVKNRQNLVIVANPRRGENRQQHINRLKGAGYWVYRRSGQVCVVMDRKAYWQRINHDKAKFQAVEGRSHQIKNSDFTNGTLAAWERKLQQLYLIRAEKCGGRWSTTGPNNENPTYGGSQGSGSGGGGSLEILGVRPD